MEAPEWEAFVDALLDAMGERCLYWRRDNSVNPPTLSARARFDGVDYTLTLAATQEEA